MRRQNSIKLSRAAFWLSRSPDSTTHCRPSSPVTIVTFAVALAFGPWLGVKVYSLMGPAWVWTGCAVAGGLSALCLQRFRIPKIA